MMKYTLGIAAGIITLTCGIGAGTASAVTAPQTVPQAGHTPTSITITDVFQIPLTIPME